MAHTPYTGKSATTVVSVASGAVTGWREVTIEENGRPVAEAMDITKAGDLLYTYMDDPLGGKGQPSCKITVSGLLSRSDKSDSGKLTGTAKGATVTVVVTTTAGGDTFTMTNGRYTSLDTPHGVGEVVPYTAVFDKAATTGVWS